MAAKRAAFRDARAASARAALRGRRLTAPDAINGFEVHKPLDALLEEPDPYFAPPPRLVATDIINGPILNALADNFRASEMPSSCT